MSKRGQHSILKRQKEVRRKERAAEKMARRQGKAETSKDGAENDEAQAQAGDNEAPVG